MLVPSRWIRGVYLGAVLTTGALHAQSPAHVPAQSLEEIGQIINAALHAVAPPDRRLSSYTVQERGIRFDYVRTLATFHRVDSPEAREQLRLTRAVAEGSDSLLEDCDQLGMQSCSRLGRAAYLHLELVSSSATETVVWVHVSWATRMTTRSYFSGASTEVFLSRTGSGPWLFARVGRRIVS